MTSDGPGVAPLDATGHASQAGLLAAAPGVERVRLRVLGTVWSVVDHDSGIGEDLASTWSRCLTDAPAGEEMHLVPAGVTAPDGEVTVVDGDQGGYRLASRLVAESIARNIGQSLMLHAGALTAPGTDQALALVAASGTGKTTASRRLGEAGWGYLTDECVSIGPDRVVDPLPKPLSVVTDPGASAWVKHQVGPDAAGMGVPPTPARLAGVVLLHRLRSPAEVAQDDGGLPRLEPVGLVEALGLLAPQSSALSRTPGGLAALHELVGAVGVQRLVYTEIDEAADLLARRAQAGPQPLVADARTLHGAAGWDAPEPIGRQGQAPPVAEAWARAAFSQAVLDGPAEAVVMTGSRVVCLGPVGTLVWTRLGEQDRTLAELTAGLESVLGEHPEAAEITRRAVEDLWREGLAEPA